MAAQTTLEYLTGYVVEWSLSVDNLFVFVLIFRYFAVPTTSSTACCSSASWARSSVVAHSSAPAWPSFAFSGS